MSQSGHGVDNKTTAKNAVLQAAHTKLSFLKLHSLLVTCSSVRLQQKIYSSYPNIKSDYQTVSSNFSSMRYYLKSMLRIKRPIGFTQPVRGIPSIQRVWGITNICRELIFLQIMHNLLSATPTSKGPVTNRFNQYNTNINQLSAASVDLFLVAPCSKMSPSWSLKTLKPFCFLTWMKVGLLLHGQIKKILLSLPFCDQEAKPISKICYEMKHNYSLWCFIKLKGFFVITSLSLVTVALDGTKASNLP